MKHILTLLALLFLAATISAQAVEAVTGYNYYGGDGFNPQGITVCNNSLFFYGTTEGDSFYNNLFISDGTGPGTSMVKRINTGYGYTIGGLTALGNKLIFGDSYNYTGELWSSDGTPAGTVPVAPVINNKQFTALNGKLYFAGGDTTGQNTSNYKDQLWVTDGTTAGTMLVKTINPTGPAGIGGMYAFNGELFFSATDGVNGTQLWTSDGTASGTVLLKMINSPATVTYISNYTTFNNKLYFSVNDSIDNVDLWVSDGTSGGTNRITNYNYGLPGLNPQNFMVFNNKLYFNGADSTGYQQLWSTDGTAAGTSMVHAERDLAYQLGFAPAYMTIYNGSLYMQGNDSLHKAQLWKSDGTPSGTQIVTTYPISFGARLITPLLNKLVFISYDTIVGGSGICVSDGTAAGSLMYELPGEYNPDLRFCNGLVPFSNALYYNASYFTTLDYQVNRVVLSTAGINEDHAANTLMLYPNPANEYLQIKNDAQIVSVQISDLSGRVIEPSLPLTGSKIPVAGLSSGLYIIQAIDETGQTYTGKFVKE